MRCATVTIRVGTHSVLNKALCCHSQETSSTNSIISIAMLFKQKKMSLFIRWKAILREWKNFFFFPVNWCCEILFLLPAPLRFWYLCIYSIALSFCGIMTQGDVFVNVLTSWLMQWMQSLLFRQSFNNGVYTEDFTLMETVSCYCTCYSENYWWCRTFF